MVYSFIVLFEQHPTIAQKLLSDESDHCLGEFENACVKAQLSLLKDANAESKIKSNVHCRFFQLPGLPAIRKSVFPGNLDVGKFLQLSGKMKFYIRYWKLFSLPTYYFSTLWY